MNLPDFNHHDISALIAGVSGGAVALIRAAKKRHRPVKIKYIFGSLFTAAFASWLVSMLLPHDMNNDIRTAVCGIAGMTGDKVISIIEQNWIEYIKWKTGGRRSFND